MSRVIHGKGHSRAASMSCQSQSCIYKELDPTSNYKWLKKKVSILALKTGLLVETRLAFITPYFKYMFSSWWTCLGNLRRFDFVGGDVPLKARVSGFQRLVPSPVCPLYPLLADQRPLLRHHGFQPFKMVNLIKRFLL